MPDPFVHLHVASGYSLQYGASHPHVLVERAAEQEMDTLALTDRDGTYGAVKFAKACLRAGIRPVLGVDLAYEPSDPDPRRSSPPRPPAEVTGAGRRLPRPATAAGHLPGPGQGRLGGDLPAGLGHPPGRGARSARGVPRSGRRAPVRWRCGRAARPGLRGRGGSDPASRRPGPGGTRAVARDRPPGEPPRRGRLPPVAPCRQSARGGRAPHPMPPGWPGWPAGSGSGWCSPTRFATQTGSTHRPSTYSTRPAGWSPSTIVTSTAATPRGSSSPASRCTRWPRRSAGPPDWGSGTPATCWPAPARSPTGVRWTRAATWAWARCTSRSSRSAELGWSSAPRLGEHDARPTRRCLCGSAARERSATATVRLPASGSGSGSTTSCRSSRSSATPPTSSPSVTSPT